ncbi:TetR/AcrR family transcriptional regulator [Actinomycetaceae bacterium TAE3-ERU4]|nr:TetR/AcrR family transcriptional regulator [Actinomycetaceae bacterium TAE3-ERU4]
MPKIIGSNLAEHREQTRSKLFAALAGLLNEQGFEAITMAQIAARAEVGRTAVYNHFPDKESLLLAYITEVTRRYAKQISSSLENVTDPIDRIRIYVEAQLRLNATTNLSSGITLRNAVSSQTAMELSAHASIVEDILRSILRDAMREGLIAEGRTEPLVRLIHATLTAGIVAREAHEYAGTIIETEEYILRALGAKVSPTSRERYMQLVEIARQDLANSNSDVRKASICPVMH